MDKESEWGSGKGGEVSDIAESVARTVEMAGFLPLVHSKYGNREDFRRESGPRACNKALIISVVLRPCLCGEGTRGGAAAGTLVPMAAASLWEPSLLPYVRPWPVLRAHERKCGPSLFVSVREAHISWHTRGGQTLARAGSLLPLCGSRESKSGLWA